MRRISELESLRGLAALSILIYHLRPAVYDIGWPRVDFFLVLTGFLLTTTILKYGDALNFSRVLWARRALRIWPLYFLAVGMLVAINGALPRPYALSGLPYYLTFTQNLPLFWSPDLPAFNNYFGHTWTLALDAQFVLVWPILMCRAGRRGFVPLCVGLVVLALILRCEGVHPWLLPARCDGYALGALMAVLFADPTWMDRHVGVFRHSLQVIGLAALAILVAASPTLGVPSFATVMGNGPAPRISLCCLLYVAILGLTVSHSGHPALGILRSGALRYLGQISYGLYVYHGMAFIAVAKVAHRLGFPQTPAVEVLMVAATIALAALSWHGLEQPLLRYRDRFRFQFEASTPAVRGEPKNRRFPQVELDAGAALSLSTQSRARTS